MEFGNCGEKIAVKGCSTAQIKKILTRFFSKSYQLETGSQNTRMYSKFSRSFLTTSVSSYGVRCHSSSPKKASSIVTPPQKPDFSSVPRPLTSLQKADLSTAQTRRVSAAQHVSSDGCRSSREFSKKVT